MSGVGKVHDNILDQYQTSGKQVWTRSSQGYRRYRLLIQNSGDLHLKVTGGWGNDVTA